MAEFGDAKRLGFDPDRLSRLQDWMTRNVDIGRYSGSSLLLARHGEIAAVLCDGQRSIADDKPYERDTIVRIYSMTKMITSIVLMQFAERGLFHLDAPVSNFLPEFSDCHALIDGATSIDQVEACATPTLHQLLTHTSGLTYGFNTGIVCEHYVEQKIDYGKNSAGNEAATKRLAQMPLVFQPGKRWEYSHGTDVLGRVIEVLAGKPLVQVFKEQILDPLGMVDTAFSVPPEKVERFADCYFKAEHDPLYCNDKAETSEYLQDNVQTFSGGGGLVSTLDDYHKFGEMIRQHGSLNGEKIIGSRTLKFMRSNHLPADIASMGPSSFAENPMEGVGFGLGGSVALRPALARTIGNEGEFGWGGMASTLFWHDPVEDLICVYFTQLVPSSSYPTRPELKSLVYAALAG